MYHKEYNESLIKKNLSVFVRVMMMLSVILRIFFFLEFVGGLAFQFLYDTLLIDYSEETQKKAMCTTCFVCNLMTIILSVSYMLVDVFFVSNSIGAYVRHHYGAEVDDSDKKNLKAVIELNEENPSFSARCFGFGCCNGIGALYQRNVGKDMVRAENSKCSQLGNYMCLSIFPFPWTVGWVKRHGYENTILISFFLALIYFAITTAVFVRAILCYVNKEICIDFSSSSLFSSASS